MTFKHVKLLLSSLFRPEGSKMSVVKLSCSQQVLTNISTQTSVFIKELAAHRLLLVISNYKESKRFHRQFLMKVGKSIANLLLVKYPLAFLLTGRDRFNRMQPVGQFQGFMIYVLSPCFSVLVKNFPLCDIFFLYYLI